MSNVINMKQATSLMKGWAKASMKNGAVDPSTALSVAAMNRVADCPTTASAAVRLERVVKRLGRQLA